MYPTPKFNPYPFPYHHEIELRIDGLSHTGKGIGRVNNWVVMVAFALPGELVKVRIYRNHKNYSEADLVRILQPATQRVKPRCALFGHCGGCQYQNYAYEAQLEWKRRHVEESLQRIADIVAEVSPTYPSPEIYHYRSKITPHFKKPPDNADTVAIGFEGIQGRKIIDVENCPIATEAINQTLSQKRSLLRSGKIKFKRGGTLLLRDSLEGVVSDFNAVVSQKVGDLVFQFQAGSFFQNNPFILPHLVRYVVNAAKTESVWFLVDAYCGVGFFCLSASKRFEHCLGVEVDSSSVHWAEINALANAASNCTFKLGKAETVFDSVNFSAEESALIIDPPRKGCDERFLDQLFAFRPQRVVYVSCAPDTQARDLKVFVTNGYKIVTVQPFDLFPQTRHIENVVTLNRC